MAPLADPLDLASDVRLPNHIAEAAGSLTPRRGLK